MRDDVVEREFVCHVCGLFREKGCFPWHKNVLVEIPFDDDNGKNPRAYFLFRCCT
jgi:hypothetical protein